MANDKPGKCEQCGKQANLRNNHGKRVCPTCGVLRGAVNKKKEMVIGLLKEFGSWPQGDDVNITEANETIKMLRGKLDKVGVLTAAVKEEMAELERENIRLKELSAGGNGAAHGIDLHALAWKFAEGMIYGDITGIDVEDLRMLRGQQEEG